MPGTAPSVALGDPKSKASAWGLVGAPLRAPSGAGKRAIWPRGCYVPGADLPFLIIFPRLPACALPAPSHSSVGMNHLRALALLFPSSTGRPRNKEPQREEQLGLGDVPTALPASPSTPHNQHMDFWGTEAPRDPSFGTSSCR